MVATRKILVVDDEPTITKSCRRILAEAGYEVDTTESGRDGLNRAFAQDFDLVMTDLKMPDLDGMELARTLRSERPLTAVVVITGYGTPLSRLEAAELGVSDYIEKPFTPERIRSAVDRAIAPAETLTRVGPAPVSFRRYASEDWPRLFRMYLTFEPKAACQGLPPFKALTTRRWLSDLVENPRNTNFVLVLGREVVAHAALVHYPNYPLEQEVIIFVHQDHRRRGLGRRLLLAAMNWACLHLELRRVWLSVESYNVRARRLYASVGFAPVPSETMETEIEMEWSLRHRGRSRRPPLQESSSS